MSEERKYVTFRDLRTAAKPEAAQESTEKNTTTSTSSSPSTASIPSTSSTPSTTSTAQEAEKAKKPSVAPDRDFQRVPNSVTRRAIPEGLFRGKSKQVWDYLWSISRGAIVPVRAVRKSRKEIKAGAGLGSMVTVDAALEHLQAIGLVKIRPAIGSLIGNEYEVFTPEEAYTSTSSTPSISSSTSPTQKVDILDILESSISSTTQVVDNPDTYRPPKTSFKTNTENDDDEAFARFVESWKKAAREITGREPSGAEAARWQELADVLIAELKIAAARTTVSSVPAFLSEHLRRRLWKKDKQQLSEESRADAGDSKAHSRNIDISKCPDCGGSGMYYPEGYEKGVAKCKHERLKAESPGE